MDGSFEKGSVSGGGEAQSGDGREKWRQDRAVPLSGIAGRAGAAPDRLPGQMPCVLGQKGRSGPLGMAATSTPLPCPSPGLLPARRTMLAQGSTPYSSLLKVNIMIVGMSKLGVAG